MSRHSDVKGVLSHLITDCRRILMGRYPYSVPAGFYLSIDIALYELRQAKSLLKDVEL